MNTIKYEDIKPVGNFKEVLIKIKERTDSAITEVKEGRQDARKLSSIIKYICGEIALLEVLEEGIIEPYDFTNSYRYQ